MVYPLTCRRFIRNPYATFSGLICPKRHNSTHAPAGTNVTKSASKPHLNLSSHFNQIGYQKLLARQKQAFIWNKIEQSKYESRPHWTGLEPFMLGIRSMLMYLPFMRESQRTYISCPMEHESDTMPAGRTKQIHTLGSVATIKFIPQKNNPYTGIIQHGADYGILRASLAKAPDFFGIVPGVAIKFLIDGKPSLNFVAMEKLEGQGEYNFFKNTFSSHVAPPKLGSLTLLANLFRLASHNPFKIEVSQMGDYDQTGKAIKEPKGPDQIKLVPSPKIVHRFRNERHEFRDDLESISSGTVLYTVEDEHGNNIGAIQTTSPFISSKWGDQELFFRHQRSRNG